MQFGLLCHGVGVLFCPGCEQQVYPGGRQQSVVILSCTTAASATVLRDMERDMYTSGSTFGGCHRRWSNKYADLWDSDAFPAMKVVKTKSRQTVTSHLFMDMRLMCKEPPLWAFRCSSCQEKDGRFRVMTAHGIWLGFLMRLAFGKYTDPTQKCSSVNEAVDAASIHPSEWARRFIRMALKQPSKVLARQLRSAKRALLFLCPDAAPQREIVAIGSSLPWTWSTASTAAVCVVVTELLSLCATASLCFVKKQLGPRNNFNPVEVQAYDLNVQELISWKADVMSGHIPGVGVE